MDVKDKVVIITGASAGIGLCTARLFAKHSAKLVLAARSVDKLTQLVAELQGEDREAIALKTDMRQKTDVYQMVEQTYQKFGRIDVLINNAGQAVGGFVADLDPAAYQEVIDLNLLGPLHAMQAVVPKMRQHGGGIIVNISSMVSKMAIPNIGGYASTKYALNGLSATARAELASDNIRVLLVFPGRTTTDFGKNAIGNRYGGIPTPGQSPSPTQAPQPDTPEHVAEKILEAVQNEPAEQYMH